MTAEVIRPAPQPIAALTLEADQVVGTFAEDTLLAMTPAQLRAAHDGLQLVQLHIERIDLQARMRAAALADP